MGTPTVVTFAQSTTPTVTKRIGGEIVDHFDVGSLAPFAFLDSTYHIPLALLPSPTGSNAPLYTSGTWGIGSGTATPHGTAASRALQTAISVAGQIYTDTDSQFLGLGDGVTAINALINVASLFTQVTPTQFALGSDAANIQACFQAAGLNNAAHTVIRLQGSYSTSTPIAWDSDYGTVTVIAWGATWTYTGTGSAVTGLTHSGPAGNDPAVMMWQGGSYIAATAARFFDCTDIRSCKWIDCKVSTPTGAAWWWTNVNAFCERNEIIRAKDYNCQQVLVMERGFKTTTSAVTFAAGSNSITQTGHGYLAGKNRVKYATVGTSGLAAGTYYYVNTVIDANNYTVSTSPPDAFGNFPTGSTVTINSGSAAGSIYNSADASFSRVNVENLTITGGVYGYGKIKSLWAGPYDSNFGPIRGNISNGVVGHDMLNSASYGNSRVGPTLVEASDDGKTVTGDHTTNLFTLTNGAPASRPPAVGQAVQFGSPVGSNVVAETIYYIKTLPTSTTFSISATPGGATFVLGTDMTSGFFWNCRPSKYRFGHASGSVPEIVEPATLRNLAFYDPAQLNADGVTQTVPDGTTPIFQPTNFNAGVHGTHSVSSAGLDLLGVISTIGTALNPGIGVSAASLAPGGRAGDLIIISRSQPGFPRGGTIYDGSTPTPTPVFAWDAGQKFAFGAKALLGSLPSLPAINGGSDAIIAALVALGLATDTTSGHVLPQYATIDVGTVQTNATTTLTTATDVTASGITAAWAITGGTLAANSLDITFVGPASGWVIVESGAYVKVSVNSIDLQFCINDVTGGGSSAVSNSVENVWAVTSFGRARYWRRLPVTPAQTYTWRVQWQLSGAGTGTMSFGGRQGPVAWSISAGK